MKSSTETSLGNETHVKNASPALCAQQTADTTSLAQIWRRRGMRLGLISLFGVVLGLCGYVSSGSDDALVEERDKQRQEQALLSSQVAETEEQKKATALEANETLAEIAQQKKAVAMKADEAQAEVAQQQPVYENLQATVAKEQQANPVKIERIKSGIKVNLANEILFPSGSADLNESAVEELTRAAVELKKSPYQTVVAGFADNIAISGKLTAKYPTNWELASARAASVVQLLEKEGVALDQLLAISFGENSPVESNNTAEGRSKNRRIEIIQQRVPVMVN